MRIISADLGPIIHDPFFYTRLCWRRLGIEVDYSYIRVVFTVTCRIRDQLYGYDYYTAGCYLDRSEISSLRVSCVCTPPHDPDHILYEESQPLTHRIFDF